MKRLQFFGPGRQARGPAGWWWLMALLLTATGLTHGQTLPVTSGLQLHLKADAGVTSSGDVVSTWADQSGNGYNVSQATASRRPQLVANSTINGRPALRFNTVADGGTDYLNNVAASLMVSGSPNTVFVVARATATSNGGVPFTNRRTTRLMSYQLGFGSGAFYVYSDGVNANNNASTADLRTTIRNPFIGTFRSGGPASILNVTVNGAAQAVNQPSGMSTESGAAGFTVGTREDLITTSPWTGDYAELIVYNRALNSSEQTQVETYLSNKYGVATVANPSPVSDPPAITGFTPASGTAGTSVIISGTNLHSPSGVTFNGTAATFTSGGSTQLTAVVPAGATTGPIVVTTAAGSASTSSLATSSFTVTAAPAISGFTPTSAGAGTPVSITGTDLTGVTGVAFGGIDAASFTITSGTGITATPAAQGGSGPITLKYGTTQSVSSAGSFQFLLPTITRVEYFLDADPGFGSATALPVATPAADLSLAASIDLSSLSPGFHQLGIRSRDAGNQWSQTATRTFYYEPSATLPAGNVTRIEYFLDADPGFGNAINVPFTAATDVSGLAVTIDLTGVTPGFHQLGVRSRDAAGKWSLTSARTFYYEPSATLAAGNISKVEYFLDADPGFGNATDVPAAAATDVSGLAFAVNLSSLSPGFHQLGVRSRDAAGKWSLTSTRTFYYEPSATLAAGNVTRVEYFLDNDPGFGNAINVPFTAATDVSGLAVTVDLTSIATGFHNLQVRSRDAAGKWSLTSVRSFYYEPVLASAPNITRIEYFFDNDPGFGSGTSVALTAAPDITGFTFVADATALPDGAHSLFVRSRDANNKWSLVSKRDFVKNGCASSNNLAADLPAASYAQSGAYAGSAQNAFNGSGWNAGGYSGTIQADLGTAQQLTELRFTPTPSPATGGSVQIQTSANLSTWTTVETYNGPFTSGVPVVRSYSSAPLTNVRSIRLVFSWGSSWVSVSNVGAYNFNCAGPSIISFTPTSGPGGTSVDITGTNLTGATALTFNGVAAQSFVVNSATSITAVAPNGGSTGQICVTTPSGTACSSTNYTYPPTIATGTVSPTTFCSTTTISVPFTTNTGAYNAGNQFKFQLSDASGNFTAGSRLYGASVSINATGGTVSDSLAFRTPAGSGYRVRVVSTNPVIVGTPNAVDLTVRALPVATASSNSPVVYNGTIQLSAGPAGQSAYQWYARYTGGGSAFVGSGASLNLTNAQPSQSGKYFVYVTNSGGCQDSASVNVLVQPNAVPVLTMSQFGYNGCAGASLNVGFSVSGNNFLAGNTITAQLSDASGSFTAPATIGSVAFTGQGSGAVPITIPTGTPTGTGYRIRLVGSNPGVTSQTDNGSNLSLTTQPTAAPSSNSPVAYGSSIQLLAQAVAGASYFWIGPNFSSTQQNPVIPNATQANAGTYTLFVTVNGCQSPGMTTQVTVNPSAQPILTMAQFNGTLCPGTSLNVGFSVAGNTFGAGNIITAQLSDAAGSFAAPTTIGSVAFTGQGNGSVTVTLPQNQTAGTGYRIRLTGSNPAVVSQTDNGSNLTIPVTLVATATGNSPVPFGGTIQLSAGPAGASSYQWYVNYTAGGSAFVGNGASLNLTNAQPSQSGRYFVMVNNGGCQDSASVRILVQPAPTTTVALTTFGGDFCAGSSRSISYAIQGADLNAGNLLSAQLSDASGSFAAPTTIGSISRSTAGSGSFTITWPTSLPAQGLGYRVRLVSSSPVYLSNDNGSNLTLTNVANAQVSSNSPVTAGSSIQLSATAISGAAYSWTGPNGFNSSQASPTLANASAANQGTYFLTISRDGCSTNYSTFVTMNTPVVASISTGSIAGGYCPGAPVNVGFTASGMSAGNVFTAQLSDASGSFASPAVLGTLTGTGSNVIAGTIPANTPSGTGYRIRVVGSAPATLGSDNGSNLAITAAGSFTWTGGFSTDWFDGRNWSCGTVPTATSNVTIGAGASFYPVVVGNGAVVNNITVVSGAQFVVNSSFTIYGNVTNFGTWNPGGSYVFAGSGTQVIGGSTAVYFGSVTVNSTLSLSNNIFVSGNWLNNGSFLGSTYAVTWNGTGVQTIGGTQSTSFYHFINQNLTGLTLNRLIYVGGNWTNNGVFLAGGYGTIFNGAGVQVIGGSVVTNFYDLTITNTVGVTLNTGIGLGGTFTNNGVLTTGVHSVTFNGSVAQTIGGSTQTIFHDVIINNTVGVSLVSDIYVRGNWINNGQFVASSNRVIFDGTVAQIIGGTQVTYFHALTLNNPVSVTLNYNIYVLGNFVNSGVFYGYTQVGGVYTGYYVRFGGSAAQVISANQTTYFWHFYADNAAGISLATNIHVAGNYYLYQGSFNPGTFTVYFNGTSGVVQTVGGYTDLSFYGWNIGSGAQVRLLRSMTMLGSFFNDGTFYGYNLVGGVYTGYTVLFGGSSAQVLNGGGTYHFWNVTWNNLASITLSQSINVLGNWLNNGGFAAGTHTVFFTGNVAQFIGGAIVTSFYHLTINNSVSVTLNQQINLLGNLAGTGIFLANGQLVYFNGTGLQTILVHADSRFHHVHFNNATSVTLLSDIYLLGNWLNDGGFVAGGYRVFFGGSVVQTIGGGVLTAFHHLTIVNNASVQLSRAITVLGDWTTNGTFAANSFVVTFAGTVNQLISGSVIVPFYSLVINNTVGVTLGQDIRLIGGNWVNNGRFIPATYRVIFDGTVAQVIGGSATTTFHGLTVLNTTGVSLSGPIFVTGNLVNDGVFTIGTHLVTFNGTVLQTIGGTQVTIFNGITCDNAVGVALGQNIRVRGDFRNLALFTAGGYIVYFDGLVAQGIYCPSGTLTLHDVTFANLTGVTLFDPIFVTGHWLNNGGFVHGGQRVSFKGSVTQLIGGSVTSVFHHLSILTGATVQLNRTITLVGNWINDGTFLHNSLLVTFNGSMLQTIGGAVLTAFYDLTVNNAVNVSLAQNIDVVHHFVNQGGYCGCGFRTRFNGTTAQTITCTSGRTSFHDLTFDNAAGVTLLDNIGVTGLWVNNSGFVANGHLVVFNGTALQTIGGTVATAFHHWTIENNSPAGVTLLRDVSLTGNWINNGRYCGCGFRTLFNGTAPQSLTCTTGQSNFHHLTLANTSLGGVTLTGNINVSGNWLVQGVWNPQSNVVFFNGTAAQNIGVGGTVTQAIFHGITISNTSLAGVTLNAPLVVRGNWMNDGVFFGGSHTVFAAGTTAQTFGGSSATRFWNWTIQNPAGVSCTGTGGTATVPALGIQRMLTMATGSGNLSCGGNLTLLSDATGTAMVVNEPGGGICTGTATMQRFITGLTNPGYRHYASPMQLNSATVNEFADDLPVFELNPAYNTQGATVTPFPTLFQYDETRLNSTANNRFDQGWMVPTATDNLLPGRGYSAQTDPGTTVDISGVLQNGSVGFSLGRGGFSGSGWHLVGNPYPAPIDWDVVRSTSGMLNGVADATYVFAPSGRYTGTYRSYVNGFGTNGATKDIASMQGFFVRATAASASIAMTNAVRATSYVSPVFSRGTAGNPAAQPKPSARLNVRSAAGLTDEAVIYFEQGADLGFSPKHDAYKVQLNGNGVPTLWSVAGTGSMSINGLPDLATAPSIPLGVRVSQTGTYTLNAAALLNLPAGTQMWLEDRVLNRRQNLAADSSYTFQMDAAYTGSRFFLWFQAGRVTATTNGALDARTALYPNPTTGVATLELSGLREQGSVRVEVLNLLGQMVQNHTIKPRQGIVEHKLDLSQLPTGVYTVRIHTAEGLVVKRLVRQ
ncbi:T9SS type A sorting domain-containing protein [Hymenobacter sp. BT175]|uniref:T9SS type A sorting domain-containing protein n=1 Tax=Hymenobacter translucens TaxID=2886507 RepID=UPI001D0ED04A|nr:T9SS type A sorting domain-containing protein [Hymenobacter translucens]MCC2547766.1 T9SS type A sorting domain-containing protein [Hymenobacter translucens]